jgi:competence protein ComEC
LFVLDVGHGNSAVLHDEGGTVVFDTGRKGMQLERHLADKGVTHIQSMLLSHADADHIGGAATLLLNPALKIEEVLLNADSTKDSDVFEQLRVALAEASMHRGTRIDRRLANSTEINRNGAKIEVLHPPDYEVLAGVGGKSKSGQRHNSNSLSAAIRVSYDDKLSVLLAGDIEFDCLDGWNEQTLSPAASVLVFPHHGGLPGTASESEAALFAFELVRVVAPNTVIFSNHRTLHNNPRDEVVTAIAKVNSAILCACTQLPERFKAVAHVDDRWALHRTDKELVDGNIRIEFGEGELSIQFCAS